MDPATDCDDSVSTIYPGASEVIGDGVDQDCDTLEICYTDEDGDGYRTLLTVQSTDADCDDPTEASVDMPAGDCNDSSSAINPGQTEIADDGVDNDCDGLSEMSEVVDEPSGEPTSEPSATVDGEEVEADKGGCSTMQLQDVGWLFLTPMALFVTRRRRESAH